MIFFTSDTHFFHARIIEYCDRPFRTADGQPDVRAMNEALVANWNNLVGNDDVVYHLGDFGFGPPAKLLEARKQLNGKVILIRGNHDSKPNRWLLKGDEIHDSLMVGTVFMTHAPPVENPFDNYRKIQINPVPPEATIILCGHVHEKWDSNVYVSEGRARTVYNMGVDVYGMAPVALEHSHINAPGIKEAWEAKP
jgi:calcineurin-like phosphoesterase family protein